MKLHDISCTKGLIKIMPKAALFGQFVLILTLLTSSAVISACVILLLCE